MNAVKYSQLSLVRIFAACRVTAVGHCSALLALPGMPMELSALETETATSQVATRTSSITMTGFKQFYGNMTVGEKQQEGTTKQQQQQQQQQQEEKTGWGWNVRLEVQLFYLVLLLVRIA